MRKFMPSSSKFFPLAIGLLLIPLVFHAYVGLFSRYHADDYCTASTLRQLGFFGSQINWYRNWSGRFSFTFLINVTQINGPGLTPFLTSTLLAIWLAVLNFAINQAFRLAGWSLSLPLSFLTSELILYATLDSTPDIYQSIYWQTGMITYAVPLVIFTAYAAWVSSRSADRIRGRSKLALLLLSGLTTFIAGGFSETFVTMQTVALILFILLKLILDRNASSPQIALLLAGLVGSIIAMVLISLAPGNAVRQSLTPAPPDILRLAGWSFRHALAFSAQSILAAPVTFLISVFLPAVLVLIWPRTIRQSATSYRDKMRQWYSYLVGIPIVTYLIVVGTVVPSVYATSAYPAERALITAQYILSIGLVAWGMFAGAALRQQQGLVWSWRNVAKTLVIGLLGISILISAQKSLTILPNVQTFAQLWDRRDQALQLAFRQGLKELSTTSLPHMGGLAEIGKDPTEWINICVAGSYGLDRVVSNE